MTTDNTPSFVPVVEEPESFSIWTIEDPAEHLWDPRQRLHDEGLGVLEGITTTLPQDTP